MSGGRIPRDFIDELLVRVDIVDLIDSHVPLKKTGNNYVARYPFHTEKTPSFSVNRNKQFFHSFGCGASGYLSSVIATAETWRMQVFGSRGWVEVGDVEHLSTWQMKQCFVDPANLFQHRKPQLLSFPEISTQRAELEHFADAAMAGRALALAGGDEVHGVAVLEAILKSAQDQSRVRIDML